MQNEIFLTPKQALNKAYLKKKPERNKIELFKINLIKLLDSIDEIEREENQKNHVRDFLRDTFFKETNEINTKDTIDLVIHLGKNKNYNVGVIIETKRPSNKFEMVTKDNLNAKSLQELVLYYLRERITGNNIEIKNLIATNINEWFVFDAAVFEYFFAQNKVLINLFKEFEQKRLVGKDTDFFYKEIASKFIDKIKNEIPFTYFNINEYESALRNNDRSDDNKLIALYKILSPEHLLKLPFSNDSNSLDKNFYNELLHIIGLSETKEGAKKLIERKKAGERNPGSLLESIIFQMEDTKNEEQLFNDALELVITWINRILFLKLLESQQVNYQKGNPEYKFLNIEKISGFDELNNIFFKVLAIKNSERHDLVKIKYKTVPYLNSSLFEKSEIETQYFPISQITDGKIPTYSGTVLKDNSGKKFSREMNTLEYLFAFLNAYDFSSEGSEEIQEENKTLINASVLGLIFEKINGYKDGSFFTPGFITMYMSRETIRRATITKFNEVKGWKVKDITELYNKIEDINDANKIINNLKICDPAVGSGHFLVSALNELLSLKSELHILTDKEGKRLKEYNITVENDELIVTNEDGSIYSYNPKNPESRRLQEALFQEKRMLIENCLFGVDINENSVKICRLRLWIELLKNAYYTKESEYTELETLPNIDINIKCGNSLISRFDIDVDLKSELKKLKYTVQQYKDAVYKYKNASGKDEKHKMEQLVKDIKFNFQSRVEHCDKRKIEISKLLSKIDAIKQGELFGLSKSEIAEREKSLIKFNEKIKTLEAEIEEIKNNKIYNNAFEWRFEFPEVLNDNGDFDGFDVVIGNPPYGLFNKKQNQKIALTTDELIIDILKLKYPEATGGVINASKMFYSLGFRLMSKTGIQAMIIPYGILTDTTSANLRKHIFNNHTLLKIDAFPERDNTNKRVFEDVKMSTAIIICYAAKLDLDIDIGISYDKKIENTNRMKISINDIIKISPELLQIPLTDKDKFKILLKVINNAKIIKMKSISECLTGEVDMTFAKSSLTENNKNNKLLKGVQIDRYLEKNSNEEISQGVIEYLDYKKFSQIYAGKKLDDATKRRIVLQGLTGVNETHRLKATIVAPPCYLANSCNYILENDEVSLEYLLALLNSSMLNFIFKTKSTNSNVNGYEVDDLPIIIDKSYSGKLETYVSKILAIKKTDPSANTSKLESEIDKIVYKLYQLSDEEIEIIDKS